VEEDEFRPFDGVGTNEDHIEWGTAGQPYARIQMDASYYGGTVDGVDPSLPSARSISNLMAQAQNPYLASNLSLSQMLVYWGQFVTTDIASIDKNTPDSMPIPATDPDDVFIDKIGWATSTPGVYAIPFTRAKAAPGTGAGTNQPKSAINTETHWLDGSAIYGATKAISVTLWDNTTGKMYLNKASSNPPNGNLVAGNAASNVHPPFRAFVNLFILEHNSIVARSNETDPLIKYQRARKLIIAMIQSITTREYLAALTGTPLTPYAGYDPTVDPAIDHFFSAVAFRYGHSSVASFISFEQDDFQQGILLRDATGFPNLWNYRSAKTGLTEPFDAEGYLRGLANTVEMNVDPGVVDDLRNYLVSPTSPRGGLDLLAINIQRARDVGIPRYNQARSAFGLSEYSNFDEITDNIAHQNMLKAAYNNNISQIDAYVGALCEPSRILDDGFHHRTNKPTQERRSILVREYRILDSIGDRIRSRQETRSNDE